MIFFFADFFCTIKPMQLAISRIDPSLPLPSYQTKGAVAFDLYAREDMIVQPKSLGLISTNIIICLPDGYVMILASRSSTPARKGLMIANGIGIIDQDFCGPSDELKIQVYNFTDVEVVVSRGERIAQAMVLPIEKCELIEIPIQEIQKNRGGFGTTGSG